MMASGFLEAPEIALDQNEAKSLAEAIRGVGDQYQMVLDPRTIAWGNLLMVCGMVYGPRIIAIRNRAKKDKGPKVVNIRPDVGQGQPQKQAANAGPVTPGQLFGFDIGVHDD